MAPGFNSTTCFRKATSNGIWQGDNPIDFSVSLLILQICLVLAITRSLAFFLKPLRQPRVIAEIIGGILLGPSAFGRNKEYMQRVFPKDSITVLESIADLGLIFFLFLVGLELDLQAIRRTGKQALAIAASGITLPFLGGVGVSVVLHNTILSGVKFSALLVFMGVAMSITAFPVLARILAERKLLTTDVGQMAMSAAAVNDVVAWILLALAVALSGSGTSPAVAAWVLLSGLAFLLVMFFAVKPIFTWLAQKTIDNEPVSEIHVAITLAGVLAAAFATDAIGIHAIFGGFVFGLIIPKEGPFAGSLIEKIEDLVTIIMLPLYFASSGLKTDIGTISSARSGGLLVLIIATACVGKILGTFLVAIAVKMGPRKALTLGFLMNTKGLVEIIVLNIGKDRKVLNDEAFAIMVLMALFTTFITTPVVIALYKPARRQVPYTRRTINMGKPEDELRVLACVHGITNVHATINMVEASRGTQKQALNLYILHLIELSERSSLLVRVQKARRDGRPFWNYNKSMQDRDDVVVAFEAYGQLSKVKVRPMTVISNFHDMHEDICATAAEKRASIILLPFHKYARPGDPNLTLESYNPGFRSVNQHVLQHAPCSVGILIDRGMGMAPLSSSNIDHNVTVFFFGGPDDREALALGYRMAEHPGVNLAVIRFIPASSTAVNFSEHTSNPNNKVGVNTVEQLSSHGGSSDITSRRFSHSSPLHILTETYQFLGTEDMDMEMKLDEECLTRARSPSENMSYEERATMDPVESARDLARNTTTQQLILVGKVRRASSILAHLAGTPAEQCAELGPIGDALAAPGIRASILVVQQHDLSLVYAIPHFFTKTLPAITKTLPPPTIDLEAQHHREA